ncbi:MAG: chain length determinant protein EpsF [Telluria sp.]
MNFAQFLLILKARKKIILLTLAVTVFTTLVVSLILPKSYKAETSLVLNYKGVDPLTGVMMPGQLMPGYMATQIDIISSKNVALRVVDALHLANNPAVIQQFNDATDGKGRVQDWLAEALLKRLDVQPSKESSVIEVSFKGSDPQFSATVANTFAEEYQKLSVALKNDPMKKASSYFNEQTKQLRDELEAAQAKLSKYQQDHGIVSVDNRLDVESNRLNDLSTQLVIAQSQLADAQSRGNMARGNAYAESPDVAQSPLIQNLKSNLAQAESKLAEAGARLGRNHPLYQSEAAEVGRLRAELAAQTRITSNSVSNNATILSAREATLRNAVAEQKARVLALNRTRDEMNVLQKDVESAQRALDATTARLSQTRLEGSSDQSDVAILNPAVAPTEPSSPRILLNTVLSVFLGGMLGLGLGMLAEMLDRRVRSEGDLLEIAQIPVLGVIDWRAPARRRFRLPQLIAPRRLRLQ